MKDTICDFINKYSHFILLGFFVAVLVGAIALLLEVPMLYILCAAGIALMPTIALGLIFQLYQNTVDNQRLREWGKQMEKKNKVAAIRAQKDTDHYDNVDGLTQAEVNARFKRYKARHKKR